MANSTTEAADAEVLSKTASRASHASHAHSHHGHHGHHANKHHEKQAAPHANAAVIEYGYPNGHLGFLTDEELEAFVAFKAFLADKGIYKAGPPPSHDDPTLLRFLRARRWVVEDAFKQFKDTEDWRQANQLNVLYDTIDLEAYEQSRRLYPQWTGRRDKRGIPLYLFEIRHLDSKSIATYEKTANNTYSKAKPDGKTNPRLLRLFALYENLTRFAQPLCTEMPDREHAQTTPITLSTNIVDVSGVSLRQFWNLKGHMQAASTLATAHYPETLDRIFIIGAPLFFSTVWGWVKRWFDPVTVSKIFILGHNEVLPTLLSFIERRNIPKIYGGDLDFNWGEMPNLDSQIRDRLTWENGYTDFPQGPLYWRPIDSDRFECVAVGSEKQVDRHRRVCIIPKTFQGTPAIVPEEANGHETNGNETNGHKASEAVAEAKTDAKDTAADSIPVESLAISEKITKASETAVAEKAAA